MRASAGTGWLLATVVGLAGCSGAGARGDAGLPPAVEVQPRPLGAAPDGLAPPVGDEASLIAPGWLGIGLAEDPLGRGVEVRMVAPGSPAEAAGLQTGDLVVRLDGEAVTTADALSARIRARGAGARVGLSLLRRGEPRLVAARLLERPPDDELVRREFLGREAPDFGALVPAQGDAKVSLGAYRGKVVVLEFWAPWCGVCRLLAPELTEWHERLVPAGGMVLGVAAESREEAVDGALALGIGYPVLADEEGDTTVRYRAFALPTLFAIDRRGIVRDVMIGYDAEGLGALMLHVEALLDEPAPSG